MISRNTAIGALTYSQGSQEARGIEVALGEVIAQGFLANGNSVVVATLRTMRVEVEGRVRLGHDNVFLGHLRRRRG